MKMKLFAAATVAAGFLAVAGSASAALVISTSAAGDMSIPTGETLITDFNTTDGINIDDLASFATFTQGSGSYIRDGSLGTTSATAPPPGDTAPGSWYETVGGGSTATLFVAQGMTQFSMYMGSPDNFNHLALTFAGGGGSQTLTGQQIWCQNPSDPGCPAGNGNQANGFTITYTFAPSTVNTIVFSSDSNAFEFDKLAAVVPEPASWALMIGGFGLAGATLRASRRKAALA
jgi:hypothetical protein